MSAEHAKEFIDLIDRNPELQEELKENQGILVDLAARKGFSVTYGELHEELRKRWGVDNPEEGGGYACSTQNVG